MDMVKLNVFILGLLSLLVCCHQPEERIEYFEGTSVVKRKFNVLNGRMHGLEIGYQKDGSLKYATNWEEGKKNGDAREFYPNGIVARLKYKNDILIDKIEFIDQEGNVRQISYVDEFGKIVDVRKFDSNGSAIINDEFVIPFLKKDKIKLGDSIELRLKLGNVHDFRLLTGEAMVGEIKNENEIQADIGRELKFSRVICKTSSSTNDYRLIFRPTEKGIKTLYGQILVNLSKESGGADTVLFYPFSFSFSVE